MHGRTCHFGAEELCPAAITLLARTSTTSLFHAEGAFFRKAHLSTFAKTRRMACILLMSIIGRRAWHPSRASLGTFLHPSQSSIPSRVLLLPHQAFPCCQRAMNAAEAIKKAWHIDNTVKVKCHLLSLRVRKKEGEWEACYSTVSGLFKIRRVCYTIIDLIWERAYSFFFFTSPIDA